ncbi:MAG: ATP-binding protein [Acetobacteraceae bacterium]
MSKATESIRRSILGGDRPFRVIQGGPPSGGRPDDDEDPCPVTPLGDFDGTWHFLDAIGQKRALRTAQIDRESEQLGLFRGDDTWLRRNFPVRKKVTDQEGQETTIVVGFNRFQVGAYLQKICAEQGLYDENVLLRRPGIWRGDDGLPIVHCGNRVLIEGDWRPAGTRTGNQIWIAAAPLARPGVPYDHTVGQELQQRIGALWNFRIPGGEIMLLGTVATGLLGTVARWRPNAFLCGEAGSGKTMLLETVRDLCPMHRYTNNATELGIVSIMNGHTMPIFIDESSDQANQGGAERLMDLVLASSSGDGTRAVRGKADGGFRTMDMAGSVIYGSVTPPSLLPQHLARISLIELAPAEEGETKWAEMEALKGWAKERGPGLWGRLIASAERWRASLDTFRAALAAVGCAPREQDQYGHILAGWWVLAQEGVPGEAGGREGVAAISAYIRTAEDVKEDNGGRRAVQYLLSRVIQWDGTTRQEQVGELIGQVMAASTDPADSMQYGQALARRGLRAVRPCHRHYDWLPLYPDGPKGWVRLPPPPPSVEMCKCQSCSDRQGRPVPRMSDDGGLWVMPVAVRAFFDGQRGLEGSRWEMELLRLPNAHRSRKTVRVGGVQGKAIWLPREAVDLPDDG